MRCKRKSPKKLRQKKWGVINLGNVSFYSDAGPTLYFTQPIDSNITFSFSHDMGIQMGDWISIGGSINKEYQKHKTVHIARRRAVKKANAKNYYRVTEVSSSTITVSPA